MVMMSRSYVYVHVYYCDWTGQLGESGSLEREGWGEGHDYSEVLRW
jgi:hypothetical protein